MWIRYYLFSLLPLVFCGASLAQTEEVGREEAETFLQTWAAAQAASISDAKSIHLDERAERTVESSRRDFSISSHSKVEWTPADRHWSRRLTGAQLNGQEVDEADLPELQARLRHMFGPRYMGLNRRLPPAVFTLDHVRAVKGRLVEADDGVLFKLEAELPPPSFPPPERRRRARRPPGPPAEVTLWFKDGSLTRSTFAFRRRPAGLPFVVNTTFASFDGVDLPIEMEAEGLIQRRRRERTHTMLLSAHWEFSGHRVERN